MPSLDSVIAWSERVRPDARVSGARRLRAIAARRSLSASVSSATCRGDDPADLAADVEPEPVAESALTLGDLVLEGAGPLLRLARLRLRGLHARLEGPAGAAPSGSSRRPRCVPPRGRLAPLPPAPGRWPPRVAVGARRSRCPPTSLPSASASWACLHRGARCGTYGAPTRSRSMRAGCMEPQYCAIPRRVGNPRPASDRASSHERAGPIPGPWRRTTPGGGSA